MRALAHAVEWRQPFNRPIALVAAALLIAALSYVFLVIRPDVMTTSPPSDPAVSAPGEPGEVGATDADLQRIDAAIGTWSANLARDPADFIAAVNLAELYLARADLTGASNDYDRALAAVDSALETDATILGARTLRMNVLLASHNFAAAEQAATALLADYPELPQALAALGDARMELGNYAGADEAYRQIAGPTMPPVLARQARLAAITGSLDHARAVAADASILAEADPDTTDADRSYYQLLQGALAFQAGDLESALVAHRAALETSPSSSDALAGLGKALAATGDAAAAIASYERAVAIKSEPESLAALGDLLSVAGRTAEAESRYAQVRAFDDGGDQITIFNRPIVLFLADHSESTKRAVDLARADVEARPDVYAWDAYAWALYAAGRFDEAQEAIDTARAEGTENASLDYHAGMIAAALGETDTAAGLLRAALDRNPAFDPIGAERARASLRELTAQP